MGTDIHLEAERQLDDGTWERIPHGPEACWSCGEYDAASGEHINQTGEKHVFCKPVEMLPGDVILERSGEWVRLERKEQCQYCKGTKFSRPQFFHDRNYDVFSILADVRNGYGFAGVRTSTGFDPIAPGRGLPSDLSKGVLDHLAKIGYTVKDGRPEYEERSDEEDEDIYEALERESAEGYWGLGDHSFTWLYLSEIDDYDWDRSVTKEGWVDPVEFEDFRKNGKPSSWCGGVSGANVEHITAGDMAARIDSGEIQFEDLPEPEEGWARFARRTTYTTGLQRQMADWPLPDGSVGAAIRDRTSLYCSIQWEVPYAWSVGPNFWQDFEYLKALAPGGHLRRVRLVMGFDS